MNSIDLKRYLNDSERIIKVLSHFGFHGFKVHYNSDEDRVSCALPDGDNETSVNIYMNDYLNGVVFSRNSYKGDIFSIIEEFTDNSFANIMKEIHTIFNLQYSYKSDNKQEKPKDTIWTKVRKRRMKNDKFKQFNNKKFDKSILELYAPFPTAELLEEGVLPKVAKAFNVCVDVDQDRLLFPHFDWNEHDKIVGIQGRINNMTTEEARLLGVPKYWNYINGYKKQNNLYGWSHNYQNIYEDKVMYIFEGEKSVLKEASLNNGKGHGVAVGGHSLSESQIRFILSNTPIDTEIVLCYDYDIVSDEDKMNAIRDEIQPLIQQRGLMVKYLYHEHMDLVVGEKGAPVDGMFKGWRFLLQYGKKDFIDGKVKQESL